MAGPHEITKVTPNHGVIGDVVTITGTGFGAIQGASTVRFAPNELAVINIWSDTSIECVVPPTATTGPLRVIVGGQDPLSTRNADFFHLDFVGFPASLVDYEFQNEKNDSLIAGPDPDDLVIADARDLNKVLDHILKIQKKLGIDGSADPESLDFKLLGPADPLVIETWFGVQAGAPAPGPFPPPPFDWEPTGTGIFPVRVFPAGVDHELGFSFRVPRKARAGSTLDIRPVFVLRGAPVALDAVTLDVFGDLDGTALAPLAASGNYVVDSFSPGLPFVTGPILRSIPVDGAPPVAPPDSEVALRFSRLGTDGGDIYAGDLVLYKILVDWVR